MKVLINDGYRPSIAVVRSLGLSGNRIDVLTSSMFAPACHSRYCARRYLGPSPASDGFVSKVIEILNRESYDAFLPVGYEATLSCAQHRPDLERLTKVGIMDAEHVRLAADKRNTYKAATAVGVTVPRTAYPLSLREALSLSKDFRYPIVIKPSCETDGYSVCYANSLSEFADTYAKFCEQHGLSEDNLPMLQEFIPGYGCGFFALYQRGICKRIFMHKRIREYPASGGVSSCAESFYDPTLKDYGVRLLDSLKWHGLAMVEFRCDTRDGDFKLMEINPRFWGSLDLAIAAGVDFPSDLLQVIQGRALEYSEDYRRGLRFYWPLMELRRICQRPSSWAPFIRDVLDPRVKCDFWMRDLIPNVYEILDFVRGGMHSLAGYLNPKREPVGESPCGGRAAERANF